MAERRMFAKTIIDSDDFLDMPLSTQALYFHLSMRADDDGFINNPKKIQRSIGATDGDAAMLVAKKFIIPFASGVVVIKHWIINNYLRSDRYRETVYQDEKKALTIKGNGAYSLEGRPDGLPLVYQTETQDSIGKDRLVKDNISSSTNVPEDILPFTAEKPAEKVPYQQILDLYYQLCPTMSQTRPLKKYTDEIKSNVKARWNEYKNLDDFKDIVRYGFGGFECESFGSDLTLKLTAGGIF